MNHISLPKQNLTQCNNCNKKLTIVANYECRCKHNFCIKCRLPELHNCTFNYVYYGKEILSKNMIKVINSKIIKI